MITVLLILPTQGRIFYTQKRIGKNGHAFKMYKFRTLKESLVLNMMKDQKKIRTTTLFMGNFLRRTGLDEIPQFINILKGDMFLIGPRALVPEDLALLDEKDFAARHRVKPGITGLWQVNRKYDHEDMNYLRDDLYYISQGSLWLDFIILLKTFKYSFGRRGI